MGAMLTSRKEFWIMQAAKVNQVCRFTVIPVSAVSLLLYALGLLAFGGIILLLTRGERLLGLYAAASIAVICYTPWDPTRYIAPLIPLLLICLVAASQAASVRMGTRWPTLQNTLKRLGASLMLAAIAQASIALWISYKSFSIPGALEHRDLGLVKYRNLFFLDDDIALEQAAEWIAGHANPTDVVAVFLPHWLYARTGLKATMPPMEAETAIGQKSLDSVPVRFLIREHDGKVPNFVGPYVNKVLQDYPTAWRLVWSSNRHYVEVFERTPTSASKSQDHKVR